MSWRGALVQQESMGLYHIYCLSLDMLMKRAVEETCRGLFHDALRMMKPIRHL